MNEFLKYIIGLIIAVVALALVAEFLNPGIIEAIITGRTLSGNPVVKFTETPEIRSLLQSPDYDKGRYEYEVTFSGNVEYFGKMEYLGIGGETDHVDVIPVIDFKGMSKKASVDGQAKFTILKENMAFNGDFSASITSRSQPVRPLSSNPYTGEMKKGDFILIKSALDNNLTIKINDVYETKYGIPDIKEYTTPCQAVININCGEASTLRLKQMSECSTNDKNDCERYLKMCNGDVHIRVDDTDCGDRIITIFIEFTGGMEYTAGDDVGISFWRDTPCVSGESNYDSLMSQCDSYFLGRQQFTVVTEITPL